MAIMIMITITITIMIMITRLASETPQRRPVANRADRFAYLVMVVMPSSLGDLP
jgi:hypothetical protein